MSSENKSNRVRYLRVVTLLSLMLSDGTYTVLRRYSRGVLHETYSVNEVLLMAEVIKLSFSCYMIASNNNNRRVSDSGGSGGGGGTLVGSEYASSSDARPLSNHLMKLVLHSRKMLILALVYGVGNILSYFALARIGAGAFVVIANLKTLTTAGFSVLMLGRRYSWVRWRALILMVSGVILFVLPTLDDAEGGGESSATGLSSGVVIGCLAELIVITLSGFAAIYFESAIKNDSLDVWERNFQLGLFSIIMYIFLLATEPRDGSADFSSSQMFANWTPLAVALSFLGASGGLLVALSIKYGDAILKTLAVSGSIIYASVVDNILLGGRLTGSMVLSAVVVIIAMINYTFDSTPIAGSGAGTKPSKMAHPKVKLDCRKDAMVIEDECIFDTRELTHRAHDTDTTH